MIDVSLIIIDFPHYIRCRLLWLIAIELQQVFYNILADMLQNK